MPILKQVPWVSLILLLLSYSTLGWVISETNPRDFVWLILVLAVLVFIGSLTTPWYKLANFSNVVFKSSLRTFLSSVLLAFLFFVVVAWFRLFLDTLLIISAAILAKIDFQTAGFKQWQAFLILSILSLTGLAFGAAMHIMMTNYLFIQ
ncbi:MAG: hypothetical protein KME32_10755 [Mojavia pulchra JT2-VF2]|jgi:glucose-6-phosphate-specific signal transduction histidine kinase|uniref:Uncharacterized protein n=1 Tax=Mojavia pulchra JT2-VF2 TaxID=287848 RepID=A0A951PWI8_9NOST|nr:hypothetical protein [Mojavia pulchra JT2-VF2]